MSIAYVLLFTVLVSVVVSVLYATWQPSSKERSRPEQNEQPMMKPAHDERTELVASDYPTTDNDVGASTESSIRMHNGR
jgi:hypothetical protein